jgi:hypothetical protein
MCAIRDIQEKYDEVYFGYIEEYFAKDNEEVCHFRRFIITEERSK